MTASYYTSYETSVALREAGAPQGPDRSEIGETFWRCYEGYPTGTMLRTKRRSFEVRRPGNIWTPGSVDGGEDDVPGDARAFRIDEILAALHGHLWQIGEADNLDYVCGAYLLPAGSGEWRSASSPPAKPWGPVEAAAAVWLAVLRAGKEQK